MPAFTIKREAYTAIETEYSCVHSARELRLRIIKDGRPTFYRQCTRCGNAGKAIARGEAITELNGFEATSFDNELEPRWYARKQASYVATFYAIKPALEAEYQAYLSSKLWYVKRNAAIRKANGICECCEHYPATQAHHITYERIGQELPSDLMAVCSFCHELLHGKKAL